MSEKNGKVTWTQLIAIIGITGAILGWLFTKLEKIDDYVAMIRIDVETTKTDVGWLRVQFERLSGDSVSTRSKGTLLDRMK